MITVRCSILESIRNAPRHYGELLASGNLTTGGGHGMLDSVKTVLKEMLEKELSVSQAIKKIEQKFSIFRPTRENRERQAALLKGFVVFCDYLKKMNLVFVKGIKLMKWDFTKDVRLTGQTPWIFKNEEGFFAVSFSEKTIPWQGQLKFPLLQSYLADQTIKCGLNEMNMGVFCFQTGKLEVTSFKEEDIDSCFAQTETILIEVYKGYNYKK
jgi:hypothetical protein